MRGCLPREVPETRGKYAERKQHCSPHPPLQKRGVKEESDGWVHTPPRAAPAHSKGGAAAACPRGNNYPPGPHTVPTPITGTPEARRHWCCSCSSPGGGYSSPSGSLPAPQCGGQGTGWELQFVATPTSSSLGTGNGLPFYLT